MFKKLFYISLILLSYHTSNSQEIKNYSEAKSVVISYLDTIKSIAINELKHKSIRKYIVKGGNNNALHYRKKVKIQKSGIVREEISIYNASKTIGYIVLYNKELFYAKVWYKVNPNRTDLITTTKEEYTTSIFLENSYLNEKHYKLSNK